MKDYKVRELLTKPYSEVQDILTLAKHIKPNPDTTKVFRMKFVEVNNLKEFLGSTEGDAPIRAVALVAGIDIEKVMEMRITEYFGYLNSIVAQVKSIIEAEDKGLQSKHTDFKWEAVEGSKRLAKFGYYNTLEQLSTRGIAGWEEIRQLPYNEVFLKLLRDKEMAEIEREMNDIKSIAH